MGKTRDFGGWATRFNIKCADGRTIMPGAFDDCDGKTVPLVWNHMHDSPLNVLGHAILHCKDEGVYADCYLNDTTQGKNVKEALKNGDYKSLSIYANELKHQNGIEVVHGVIRELSLVLAGANPGAFIDTAIAHSEEGMEPEEAVIYDGREFIFGEDESNEIQHSVDNKQEETPDETPSEPEEKETNDMGAEVKEAEELQHSNGNDETVEDVINTMDDKQKKVLNYLVKEALKKGEESNSNEGEENMKHNVFEQDNAQNSLRHSLSKDEMKCIFDDAERFGSLKSSFLAHKDDLGIQDILMHGTDVEYSQDVQEYMVNDPSFLFPQPRSLNNPPEFIKRDTTWVSGVLNGAKHVPFSRIKSVFADITEDEARAKGYIKGDKKINEVFTLLRRSTDPQTIYKLQSMDRDDVLDITDFDVVAWIKGEMQIMLDEEIARAMLVGDGKLTSDRTHIAHDHIRPIWLDDDLFTIKYHVEYEAEDTDEDKAKAYIKGANYARIDYKGSGRPTFFTTEKILTDMLLAEDNMGHRLYKSEAELATAMRVSSIVTVPIMEGLTRTVSNVERELIGIIVNMSDYTVGNDKGGEKTMFENFDIDYNKMKYLIETRRCGALTKPYSAIVIEASQKA